MTTADNILTRAAEHMRDRASTYDKPEGERSMAATVTAFNAMTGHQLTEEQGWLFMETLKLVRSQQGGYRADNYEEAAAYAALRGEAAAAERSPSENRQEQPLTQDWCPSCGEMSAPGAIHLCDQPVR